MNGAYARNGQKQFDEKQQSFKMFKNKGEETARGL